MRPRPSTIRWPSIIACTQRTTFKSHEGAPSSSGAAEGLSGPELVGEHRTSNPQLGACRMWVSMRLGSLMLCSCACQAAVLTNPFDPAHADSCCVLVPGQRFDASTTRVRANGDQRRQRRPWSASLYLFRLHGLEHVHSPRSFLAAYLVL
jgi:hypothetical protein